MGYDTRTREFTGTLPELLRLGVRVVQSRGWTVTHADDTVGLLTFETTMSWGTSGLAYLLKERFGDPATLLAAVRDVVAGDHASPPTSSPRSSVAPAGRPRPWWV